MHRFLKFILEWNSTCFGQFLCPSSGVFHCTQEWCMSYMFVDSLWAILLASCQQTCMTHTNGVFTVKNPWWWTEELSETRRVSFQNKFEKLMHLTGLLQEIHLLTISLAKPRQHAEPTLKIYVPFVYGDMCYEGHTESHEQLFFCMRTGNSRRRRVWW